MSDLRDLRIRAERSAGMRGHAIAWAVPWHGEYASVQTGYCRNACAAWVQITTRPMPNGIDIGGPAVAVGCPLPEGTD